jgi:16S rRNA C967 or C1407 C5-methylase (RsmB/RsmF family)/NOL1/NOP2/fmu family ribosome biogenesis protein
MSIKKHNKLPLDFFSRMQQTMGNEFEDLAKALEEKPPTSIRYNPFKNGKPDPTLQPVPWSENAVYLPERPEFYKDPLIFAGAYYVQEASSMFIDHIFRNCIPQDSPLKILDLCAAPGGKSTLLASAMPEGSLLVSNEIVAKRALPLAENLMRWGNENVLVSNNNPQDIEILREFFDVILVDAPCSGEGMFRKDPKVAGLWNSNMPIACAQRQEQILESVDTMLKPGGHLIYSTCTFAREENEAHVTQLTQEKNYTSLPVPIVADWQITEIKEAIDTNANMFAYRFYPHKTKGEGFFAACLRKSGEPFGNSRIKLPKKIAKNYNDFKLLPKKYLDEIEPWINMPESFAFILEGELVYALPKDYLSEIKLLHKVLRIKLKGVELGKLKNNKFIPAHPLAMSRILHHQIPRLPLNYEQAVNYLKKQEVNTDTILKGWALATYEGVTLGWCKVLPNRINNYYPTELRIRKDFEVE